MNAHTHRLVFDRCRGMVVAVAECARSAGKSGVGERRCAAPRSAVLALGLLVAAGVTAQVLPSGGVVVRGAGTIQVDGKAMTVNQTTARMVTDWTSFSIGPESSVRFAQPSTSSVALNRVLGDQPSTIFGSLSANGHVYLQNPSGVLFAPGAQVNVGSLVATTLQADLSQFMAGNLRLGNGGAASGDIVNEGHITAAQGGHVVLAGPRVANRGSIEAFGGTVGLAAGQAVTVDATGAGLLDIRVPLAAIDASLHNSGRLVADGGTVSLQVAAADAARRTVMQVDGLVRAHRVENRGGQIVLSGGDSGGVNVTGTLDASGAAGERGGAVSVLGQHVALAGQAHLDASGDAGGGTLLVGGNFRGQGSEANAQQTFVGRNVTLDASARDAGDGGKVVVWSDLNTTFKGQIVATGGARSGDGGQVEVSGKQRLNFDGDVNTRSAHGRQGSLLLDPAYLEVGLVADVNGDATTGDDLPGNTLGAADFGAYSYITSARVASLLFSGNVSLEASYSLNVTAPLNVASGGTRTTLSLFSPQVGIYAPMTLNNTALTVNTNQNVNDRILIAADVRSLKTVSLTSSDIFIDDAVLSSFNVALTASATSGASIGQTSASSIVANHLVINQPANAVLSVALDSPRNQAATLNVTAHDATITLNSLSGAALDLRGAVDATLALKTDTGITQNNGPLSVGGAFTLTSTAGNVALTNSANGFAGLVTFNAAGDLSLASSGSLRATGSAYGDIALTAIAGRFIMGGDINTLCSCGTTSIDITGVGFNNAAGGLLLGTAGSRFFVRSSDWTLDNLGPLNFGPGAHDVNYVVYSGWQGADPVSGNGYYTNRDAFASLPAADAPPVSLVYNGLTTFAHRQTGSSGSIRVDNGEGTSLLEALASYTANSTGTFFNKNVGTDKGYAVAASTNAVATGSSGTTYYGLYVPGFTRPAGPWQAGTPGNAISELTPLAITVGGVRTVNRAYNGLVSVDLDVSAASLSGTIAGDSIGLSGGSGNMLDKNVGVAKPVTLATLTFGGADASNYSFSLANPLAVNISPLTLVVSGITAANKVYDATTAATITGSPTITPLVNDAVSLGGTATASFVDKNAGVAKPVALGGLTLTGADAGNYALGSTNSVSADITPRALVVSGITAANKVYDATTVATLAGAATVSPLANDVVTVAGTSVASFADKNVGTAKPVSVTGFSFGGADGGNYTAVLPTGLAANITPRTLPLSGLVASDKVYDATTAVTVAGSPAVTPLAQDAVFLNGVFTASFVDKNAGVAKPVALSGLTLSGSDAGNYTLGLTGSLTATITPYALALSGITVPNKVYDATAVGSLAGVPVVTPLRSDDVAVSGTGIATFDTKNVGDARPAVISGFTLTGVDAPNYSLRLPTTLSASTTPRPIAPTGIRAINRVADNSNTVQLNTAQASLPGVLPGDTVSLVLNTPFGLVDSPTPGVAKPVTLVGFSLSGLDAPNYSLNLRPVAGGAGVVAGSEVSVTLATNLQQRFEELRFNEYLQAVSDAQEPFRRAMAEALAAGFGKENIRKRLSLGLIFETGLAAPAIESIQPARPPASCTVAAGGTTAPLSCP